MSISDFKAGDKVRCVDASFTRRLAENAIYTVERVNPVLEHLELVEVKRDGITDNGWIEDRFEKVSEQPQIKVTYRKESAVIVDGPQGLANFLLANPHLKDVKAETVS